MKATMEQDMKYKTKEINDLAASLSESTSDRATVEEELAAVLDYLKSLESRCIAKPMTYEERVRRREAEIDGLKEALEILNGDAVIAENEKRSGGSAFLQRTTTRRSI